MNAATKGLTMAQGNLQIRKDQITDNQHNEFHSFQPTLGLVSPLF